MSQKVLSGTEAYEIKQYDTAISILQKEFEKTSDPSVKSYRAYLLGNSYNELRKPSEAIQWYETSLKIVEKEESIKALAATYKSMGNYKAARIIYKDLAQKFPSQFYNDAFKSCESIIVNNTHIPDSTINVKTLTRNQSYNEFSATVYDDKYLLVSSDMENKTNSDPYLPTGKYFSDFFLLNTENNTYANFDAKINSPVNEGVACFNSSYTEIFFTRCESIQLRNDHCRIYTSTKEKGNWTNPVAIAFFDESTNVGHPALFNNDSLLIFSVAPHGNYSSYDLYYSTRYSGTWTKAEPMPDVINSDGNEKFPTVNEDTLYFSSDKLTGLGGLDIYKTYLNQDNQWTVPDPLPAPINSAADDYSFVDLRGISKIRIRDEGFFSSSREADGLDRVYAFNTVNVIAEPEDEEPVIVEEEVPIDFAVFIAGYIKDEETEKALRDVRLKLIENVNEQFKTTDKRGSVIFDGKKDKRYQLVAEKEGYFTQIIDLSTTDLIPEENELAVTVNFKMDLKPIKLNEEIVMENIYYDFDQSFIREDAKPALDELVVILRSNPTMSIELSSHTDCRGDEDYNDDLSANRAQAAVNYILSKGINRNRIISKGYGEGIPVVNCNCDDCSEEENQQNRRTAFKVLSY